MDKYRIEKKFLINNHDKNFIHNLIKINTFFFKKKYRDRYINNIYFDDINFSSYTDNLSGISKRKKIRIRWYGDLLGKIVNPYLEIKSKINLYGYKKKIKINNFQLNKKMITKDLINLLKNNILPNQIIKLSLSPVLINRYYREYYETLDGRFRLTVDTSLNYYSTRTKNISIENSFKENNTLIVELKFSPEFQELANKISAQFPFRSTKSSKYVMGVSRLYDSVV